jgi:hyaluronoglucosaminidase
MQSSTEFNAGIIEGFFGKPWDWSARLSAISFLRERRFKFYLYAPKSDPYLRRRWREPIPAEAMKQLSGLASRCTEAGIALGIGLTPFEIYLNYDANAKIALRSKVRQINEIGARTLCILFDDMRGNVENLPDLQAQVIADICAASNAEKFIVCPTYYSFDARLAREFGSPPRAYLQEFGRVVDPGIDIFWTGEKIISDSYTAQHLIEVAGELRRKPFIWDNHVSNDSKLRTNHLFLDPSTDTWQLPADLAAGLAINPMNQPYLSRIALCGYQQMLADPARRPLLLDFCGQLCGSSFSQMLAADYELLQIKGLDQLDPAMRCGLLDRYDSMQLNPYAQEIAAWLQGAYEFDPQCLTT